MEIAIVVIGGMSCFALVMALIWSWVEGSLVAERLSPKPKRVTAAIRIATRLKGRIGRCGRWVWDYDGDAYYFVLGLMWRIPSAWSLRAFKMAELNVLVNRDGDD